MSAFRTTGRLIEAYAESEPWKDHHDRAMVCRDIEELMAWGVHLLRGLSDREATLQARALAGRDVPDPRDLTELERAYRLWAGTSAEMLRVADELAGEGFQVDGLDEFRRAADEAQCQVELWDLEPELLTIEEARAHLQPDNPRPERYGD